MRPAGPVTCRALPGALDRPREWMLQADWGCREVGVRRPAEGRCEAAADGAIGRATMEWHSVPDSRGSRISSRQVQDPPARSASRGIPVVIGQPMWSSRRENLNGLLARKEGAEGFRLRRGTVSPPVSCVPSVDRRKSLPKPQRRHPTHVVARVGTCWRASAHKGSPLFPRRAPVLITVGPEGSLDPPRASGRHRRHGRHGRQRCRRTKCRAQQIERPFEYDQRAGKSGRAAG